MKKIFTKEGVGMMAVAVLMATGMSSCDKIKGVSDSVFGSDNEVQYIPVQIAKGGEWDFIDEKGRSVGGQHWKEAPTVTVDGIFTVQTSGGLTVYKWKDDVPQPIASLRDLVGVGAYVDGLMPVVEHGRHIKVVDNSGETKFSLDMIDGKEVMACSTQFSDGRLVVNTVDGNAGVVDKDGKVVVKPIYTRISDYSDGYALAMRCNPNMKSSIPEYFILDKSGEETRVSGNFGPTDIFADLAGFVEGGCAIVPGNHGTYQQINTKGEVVELQNQESISSLDNGDVIIVNPVTNTFTWKNKDGKIIDQTSSRGEMIGGMEKYAYKTMGDSIMIYNDNHKKLTRMVGNGTYTAFWPGGNFGVVIVDADKNYKDVQYTLLNPDGTQVMYDKTQRKGVLYYGAGNQKFLVPVNAGDYAGYSARPYIFSDYPTAKSSYKK